MKWWTTVRTLSEIYENLDPIDNSPIQSKERNTGVRKVPTARINYKACVSVPSK